MFADRETMERRAQAAAAEWQKAKAVWRRFARFLLGFAILLGFALSYVAGDTNGRFACLSVRPERDSTP